ncbi:transmembrane protein [Perilla frutescens var. frutescens]|nr:transmembrane protein [Perilla frutescens var. frutescens]
MSGPQIPDQKPSAEPPKLPSYGGGGNYTNPRETVNSDAATLRDQWRFAIKQYSRGYSQAWGTAILAGVSFFALGWIIKGANPLPSLQSDNTGRISSSPFDKDKPEHQPR